MKLSMPSRRQDHYGVGENRNEITQTTTKLGCINTGEISCQVQVGVGKRNDPSSLNLLEAGQEPRIKLAFRNASTTPVKAVALKLCQKSYYCGNKQNVKREEQFEVSRTMSSTSVPILDTVIGTQHTLMDIFIMPALPYQTANTYEGANRYIRHELKITLITALGYSNVTLRVPMNVFGGTNSSS